MKTSQKAERRNVLVEAKLDDPDVESSACPGEGRTAVEPGRRNPGDAGLCVEDARPEFPYLRTSSRSPLFCTDNVD